MSGTVNWYPEVEEPTEHQTSTVHSKDITIILQNKIIFLKKKPQQSDKKQRCDQKIKRQDDIFRNLRMRKNQVKCFKYEM